MAKKITHIKIFVSSPSDVREERISLEEIIQELNLSNLNNYDVHAELIKWETNVDPGIGDYPQEVINKDIGEDYDIFLGLLWNKYGTSTKKYGSGTIEEFNLAFERYSKDLITPKIMFYFNLSPIPIDEIDADSIKKINEFKKELGQKGVLYWEYKSFEEFQRLIRIQLPRQIIEFVKTINPIFPPSLPLKKSDIVDGDEELGLLDYVELGTANFSDVTDIVNRMTSAIGWMSKRFIEKTEELNMHVKINNPLSISLQKHIIDSSAEDMNSFVSRMKVEIPLFAEAYRKGLDNFSAALKITSELNNTSEDEFKSTLESLDFLITTYTSTKNQCLTFRDSFSSFPSMTKALNKAKRQCYNVLDDLIKELDVSVNLTNVIKSEFDQFIK